MHFFSSFPFRHRAGDCLVMIRKKLFLCLAWASLGLPSSLLANSAPPRIAGFGDEIGVSPFADWRQIETENFRLAFPAPLTETAQRVANLYEEAHALLSPFLQWQPRAKTQVVLLDNGDLANGMTTPVGRFGMVLLLTPPDNFFSTANYDDWLRLLVLHEYTHFLNMDITRGVWEFTRIAFGDAFLPNSLWTPWMLEGLAVYSESRFTRVGRGRSSYYEMILRAAAEAGVLNQPRFMTLDRLGGPNPWNPAGETSYFFGYQLMNQVARESGDVLGEMSYRSGNRFPFFINGNLENITGHEWDHYWETFTQDALKRTNETLGKIKSAGATPVEFLSRGDRDTLGPAISPNGKFLAYTQSDLSQGMGLWVRDLETGQNHRVRDKTMGSKLSFTPDSKFLIYSSVERSGHYNLWSDLFIYDLESDRTRALSHDLRARDPHVSPDGKTVVFTLTEAETTGLAIADLSAGDHPSIANIRKLFWPKKYGRVSTPQFHPDGKQIAFSLKENGTLGEQIMIFTPDAAPRAITADANFNRYPCFDGQGKLYFVSDRSGVDNLYLSEGKPPIAAVPMTNVTTGLAFPTFSRQESNKVYGLVYTFEGWNLARMPISRVNTLPKATATPVVMPQESAEKRDGSQVPNEKYDVSDYSLWPSILPRQWAPFLVWDQSSIYFGGQLSGFDALDRHRYFLLGAYDTQTRKADGRAAYTNRSLGVALTLEASEITEDKIYSGTTLDEFERKREISASAEYAFLWSHSSLTSILAFNGEQTRFFFPAFSLNTPLLQTRYVPSTDAILAFTNRDSSALGITGEKGRDVVAGVRSYLEKGDVSPKLALRAREYIETFDHFVLVPEVRGTLSSNTKGTYQTKRVISRGRRPQVMDRFEDSLFESVPLRGYPGTRFVSKSLYDGSLEYRYPLLRIFRGLYTHPLFLQDLTGFSFFDAHYFPQGEPGVKTLTAAGSAIELNLHALVYIPLTFKLEYDYGFRAGQGGKGDLFVEIGVSGMNF